LSQTLQQDKREYVLSKQVLRSGTAVGALIREAEFGQSRADLTSKMSMALKEANETEYWLSLLRDTDFINDDHFVSLQSDCKELIAMLVSTVKTSKS
jgi:four helix bundle protein